MVSLITWSVFMDPKDNIIMRFTCFIFAFWVHGEGGGFLVEQQTLQEVPGFKYTTHRVLSPHSIG